MSELNTKLFSYILSEQDVTEIVTGNINAGLAEYLSYQGKPVLRGSAEEDLDAWKESRLLRRFSRKERRDHKMKLAAICGQLGFSKVLLLLDDIVKDWRGPSAKQACWFLDIDKCRERDNQPARKRA